MGRFIVDYRVTGRASDTINADSKDAAIAMVAERVERDDFVIDLDETDDVDFEVRELHPVTRAGREIWTTFVCPSDTRGHLSALKESPLFAALPVAQAQEAV